MDRLALLLAYLFAYQIGIEKMTYYLPTENVIRKIEGQLFPFSQAEYSRLKTDIEARRKICFSDDFTCIRIGVFFFSVWTGKKRK